MHFTKQLFLKKFTPLLLFVALILSFCCCTACETKDAETDANGIHKLSFKSATSLETLKKLDGQTVTINGYMSTYSALDGSFIFLMNLPYQSCPFCVPNTSQLSNTIEVYPKKDDEFDYTTQAIKVKGTLVVAQDGESFTDAYGYEFTYKIVDATYTIIKAEDLSADLALWQKIASTDVINDIYNMYDYVNFLTSWNDYFINSWEDKNGDYHEGYFLYASDAVKTLEREDGQYHYGTVEGYFDDIIQTIEKVDKTAFSDLVQNIRDAEQLASDALAELYGGNYTYKYQYVEKFEKYDYIYTLNNGEALQIRMNTLYSAFAEWLASWEM